MKKIITKWKIKIRLRKKEFKNSIANKKLIKRISSFPYFLIPKRDSMHPIYLTTKIKYSTKTKLKITQIISAIKNVNSARQTLK